ncbi:MAG: ATP-binding protein [bacterium]|nr:ATP-binding protein [bacterium]
MTIVRDITLKMIPHLKTPEILLFIGARQAGKTTILKQLQARIEDRPTYFLTLEDPDYLRLLNESPKNLFSIFTIDLRGKATVFIDEIQYLSNPSNFLKYFYDEYRDVIKLIVSGSSAFYLDRKFTDSLAGRKKICKVRTLSFREFLRFKAEDQLSTVDFEKISISEQEKIIPYYGEYMLYGGYPRVVLAPLHEKKDVLQELAYSYIKKDVFDSHIRRDDVFYALFKILSSSIGQLLNASELASTLGVSKTSIDHYLSVMQKSFHICLVRPLFKNIRKELSKMPKIYFCDTGLRNFFANNFDPFEGRDDKGALLENAVYRQLIERHEEDDVKFWRTISKNEVDFIVSETYALEVKSNPKQFKESKYQMFLETYPNIPLRIASFNTKEAIIGSHSVDEVWKI